MSFSLVRSVSLMCLVTVLSLGAFSIRAQEAGAEAEPTSEVETAADEGVSESVGSAVDEAGSAEKEALPAPEDEMTAAEALEAELDAKKEEENASLRAKNDAAALKVFQKGLDLEREGDFRKAAKRYLDAEILTSDKTVKTNALTNAARAYRQAELYGKEFDCIERLINEHMTRIDFTAAVNREYEIADAFYKGHRGS